MIDLRMFLEEDILNFLEERLSEDYLKQQSFTPARAEESFIGKFSQDYESQLLQALDARNIMQAKNVLHALKAEFDALPLGSVERETHQQELHRLYEVFKKHLESNNTFAQMEQSIDSLGGAPTPPVSSAYSSVPARSSQEFVSLDTTLLEKPSLQRSQPKTTLDDFQKSLAALDSAIAKKEVVRAHKLYTQAKSVFQDLPKEDQLAHKQDMLTHHSAIEQLIRATTKKKEQDLQQEPKERQEPQATIEPSELSKKEAPKKQAPKKLESAPALQKPIASTKQRIPQEILEAEQVLLQAITAKDITQAMQKYDVLRDAIMQQNKELQVQCAPLLQRYYISISREREKRKHQPKIIQQEPTFSAQGSALLEQSERKLAGRP